MGDLTKNLSRHEFACECGCGMDTIDFWLPAHIQEAADFFSISDRIDVRIDISGPNRCVEHNESVQKKANSSYVAYSSKSTHMDCRAVDFKLFNRATGEQIDPDRIADYLDKKFAGKFGVGWYNGRTHFDTRTGNAARWDSRHN